jgi:hypothetical protein
MFPSILQPLTPKRSSRGILPDAGAEISREFMETYIYDYLSQAFSLIRYIGLHRVALFRFNSSSALEASLSTKPFVIAGAIVVVSDIPKLPRPLRRRRINLIM